MKILLFVFIFLATISFVNAAIVINEIMYDPAGNDNNREWIEIYNNGNSETNLTGYTFFEENTSHRLTLVQGDDMIIRPEEYIVIVQNSSIFLQDYENYSGKIVDSSFSLSNVGEYIALKNSDRQIIDEVNYSSQWGGRNGTSLELINPNMDNNISESWNYSLQAGGTPGRQNSVYSIRLMHTINLNQGWNLISSYLISSNLSIESIFAEIVENRALIIVKDWRGRFYVPGQINNINIWNPDEAYLVKVSGPSTLVIRGEQYINPAFELREGWNYIAYPLTEAHSMNEIIENVLRPLIEENQLVILKDGYGNFCIPEWNFSNIREMRPGEGYQIKLRENTSIDFSALR